MIVSATLSTTTAVEQGSGENVKKTKQSIAAATSVATLVALSGGMFKDSASARGAFLRLSHHSRSGQCPRTSAGFHKIITLTAPAFELTRQLNDAGQASFDG